MKTSQTIGMLLVAGSAILASCTPPRVNDHPIGIYPNNNVYPPYQNELYPGQGQSNELLNDVRGDSSLNSTPHGGFNPDPGNTGGGTIHGMIGGEPRPVQPHVGTPSYDPVPRGNDQIAAPRPVTPAGNSSIPYARRTNDPTVVISPYDSTKKIKILNRRTNKPYPSGTILRDTNYPNEIKKFRVP